MNDFDKYLLRQMIAGTIDYPSVFMGGPSRNSTQKAIKIVMADYDIVPKSDDVKKRAELVASWRTSPWDSLDLR